MNSIVLDQCKNRNAKKTITIRIIARRNSGSFLRDLFFKRVRVNRARDSAKHMTTINIISYHQASDAAPGIFIPKVAIAVIADKIENNNPFPTNLIKAAATNVIKR